MPASIRPANEGDADFLAWAISTADRSHLTKGWFDIVLASPEQVRLDFFRRLTIAPALSSWHYSHFLISEEDCEPAAALSVFRAGDAYPFCQQAMAQAGEELGWGDAEQRTMWRRGAFILGCIPETADDTWAVENVATRSTHRGRGIACELLASAARKAQRNGARQIQVTFMIGNDAAERAYAKAGFVFADEKRSPEFEAACGAPGLRRYSREL